MPSETLSLEARIKTLNTVLADKHQRQNVDEALRAAKGDMSAALSSLKGKLPHAALQKIGLAHSLAELTDDHLSVVSAIANEADITNLRDVALHFNVERLAALVDAKSVPEDIAGFTKDEKKTNFAISLQNKLFTAEPTAVLQRMVRDAEVPIADANQRKGVVSFLANQPEFNIGTTSIYIALKRPEAFKDIPDEHRAGVVENLKTLQRVKALSPVPAAVPVLMNANLTSAVRVSEMPESTFFRAHSTALGEGIARQVYTNAVNTQIRNEHAMVTMRQAWRGTDSPFLGGLEPMEMRAAKLQAVADKHAPQLNLEALFGSIDYCECDDCLSVYSPAAYFVEILQYLRNNDLDPLNPHTGQKGIDGTPLEKLFRRRPDLGCLELTCENTFTVLPYIDLVNEVMESFVVNLGKYSSDTHTPKQATLEVFNVIDETTSELLAQPQHVNYQAYCILKDAVYPFTLPYHQPIDVIRIWLTYMGTSRYELLDTFRTATELVPVAGLTPAQQRELQRLHALVLDRSADAEFLNITQEEHIILTREAFWPKDYFDLVLQKVHSDAEYQQKIGVKAVHEYYGYGPKAEADMLSLDETSKVGLTFVKQQFLPRSGIQYTELVELLKTRFINPAFPEGRALTILESIRFSYRFLQTLVDAKTTDRKTRYAKLIDFLNSSQALVPQVDALLHPDLCHQQSPDHCLAHTDFQSWVYCYFERIGQLIVLESGEGPQLAMVLDSGATPVPFAATLTAGHDFSKPVARVDDKGTIISLKNNLRVGYVTANCHFVGMSGEPLTKHFGADTLGVFIDGKPPREIGAFRDDGLVALRGVELVWLPSKETCNLDKVRLTHLDGSPITSVEYDRMQRFIRLWRKLGWSIPETDLALIGSTSSSSGKGSAGSKALTPGGGESVSFAMFEPDCSGLGNGDEGNCRDTPKHGDDDGGCPELARVPENITVGFLHQLVAIRKLLDLTGLTLDKQLSFWADIGTTGEKSLYSRLFLTPNLLGIDKVFKSDANGNYLTQEFRLSDHIPVLMAALKMKSDDVAAIVAFRKLSDVMTFANVSAIYRHGLLAKILHVPASDLEQVFALFGDPFSGPDSSLALLHDWGSMEDAGFTFRQLNYLIRNHDDLKRPLAPSAKTVLKISKTLYDGLNAIDLDQKDIPAGKEDEATGDLIRAKAGLLFEASVVEEFVGLLEGTTSYITNAPPNQVLKISDGDSLEKKLKYSNQADATPPSASIEVTGILTDAEKIRAKALSANATWASAIDRVGKKALQLFNNKLIGIFPDSTKAIGILLAGDVDVAVDPDNPAATDNNTAAGKRYYFLQFFLPFVRQRLAHQLIVSNLSSAVGLTADVTDVLLTGILLVDASSQHAITVLEQIHQRPPTSGPSWKGYLIPSADDEYTFVARSLKDDLQPPDMLIDGQTIAFTIQQEDPSNVWSAAIPLKLRSGKLYLLEVQGQPATALQWKTSSSPTAPIPSSALLPDYSSTGTGEVFRKLYKAALLVNGFSLTVDEVTYWQAHGVDFSVDGAAFDFNLVTLGHWRRLRAYMSLRDQLPKTEFSLLDLFLWAAEPDAVPLSEKIAAVTQWSASDIAKLITPEHFDLERPDAFHNEIGLLKLQKALQVAGAIGTDIDRLFTWANPMSKFSICHQIAEGIRATLRARYDQEDWEQVIKPLNDKLREDQKQALISYLLVQPDLRDWGVADADSLFEFFLIDVQMDACMETSRIKQAISTVQLFVQRCMLGLEAQYGVSNDSLDRDRWDWMQKYRVWEANRKVFLYPENWIKPELREDKSSIFKELKSALLQNDVGTQNIENALKNYLFRVDEVARLQVVGLFVEQDLGSSGARVDAKFHFFAKTRNAPFLFYYRYFHVSEQNWYPWERVDVDVPTYDREDNERITDSGSYLIPVVWERRLLLFFPQITPANTQATPPVPVWAIKMGWSERRNGKWTPKQVSSEAIYTTSELPINELRFVPRSYNEGAPLGVISVYRGNGDDFDGAFWFNGSQVTKGGKRGGFPSSPASKTQFHYYETSQEFHSLQTMREGLAEFSNKQPFVIDHKLSDQRNVTVHDAGNTRQFGHPFAHQILSEMAAGGLERVFDFYLNRVPVDIVNTTKAEALADAFGGTAEPVAFHELKRPYALYNWEAAFHAPMLLVDRLLAAQQFEQALQMCHYILNPFSKGADDKRFWQFLPFKKVIATNVLESLFLGLQPNTPDAANGQINEWRNKPFQPHAIARARPSAYMKCVAMKYIEILTAYGDYYFRQNTLETIPLAIQCYVFASHVYGPSGQAIPKRGKTAPQTYCGLLDKWDAFGNAMVELELLFPFSNQTALPVGEGNGVVGLANVFGFASTLYFCIPDNPQLRALRATIDDRLFKIRHCEDIDGVVRHLPLFEPPIDPALLVQATAQGLSLSNVLNDLNSPMPNYRFNYLLQKALELCSEVKALGNAFLSAKEKGDAEMLSRLRAKHEGGIHNLVMEVKKLQFEEAEKAQDALQQSRKAPESRLKHYLALIGEGRKVPGSTTDWTDLDFSIEPPVDESGLKLVKYEKEEMDKASEANDKQEDVGRTETLASIFHALPNLTFPVTFLPTGYSSTLGGANLGSAMQAVARANQVVVGNRTFSSTNAGRKANFLRRLQSDVQQANAAGYEIKSIDKHILTQQIRMNIAQQEITNQQKQIDNAQEMEEFLRSKYTNPELYTWMDGQIRTLYHQAYNLAYDLAKRAEKVFRFERGLTTSNFIQYGYWDVAYDGLFSGERLYIGLKQLEAAYQEQRGHDFEVSKSISLRQVNPLALIQLKETGSCEFELPEVLFDMDWPGHFMRRIKSVSLRIPCILGNHTSLNCTLRLLEHKYRINAKAKGSADYPEQTDQTEDRFRSIKIPINSIAVSSMEDEHGVFELNFHDERYLPFEGAGAISKWLLELPHEFRQFDYDTITDVVMRLRYTSADGGDKLKAPAAASVQAYIKSVEELSREEGLFSFFDLKNDFPNEWYSANHPAAGATTRTLTVSKLADKLPIFTKGKKPQNIVTKNMYLFASSSDASPISSSLIKVRQGGDEVSFGAGKAAGAMSSFAAEVDAPLGDLEITIGDTKTAIDKLFLVHRYVLSG